MKGLTQNLKLDYKQVSDILVSLLLCASANLLNARVFVTGRSLRLFLWAIPLIAIIISSNISASESRSDTTLSIVFLNQVPPTARRSEAILRGMNKMLAHYGKAIEFTRIDSQFSADGEALDSNSWISSAHEAIQSADVVIAGWKDDFEWIAENYPAKPKVNLGPSAINSEGPQVALGNDIALRIARTADLARTMRSSENDAWVVIGDFATDSPVVKLLRSELERAQYRQVRLLDTPAALETLLLSVDQIPSKDDIYYLPLTAYQSTDGLGAGEVITRLDKATEAPIFSLWYNLVKLGGVGGYVFYPEQAGFMAVQAALDFAATNQFRENYSTSDYLVNEVAYLGYGGDRDSLSDSLELFNRVESGLTESQRLLLSVVTVAATVVLFFGAIWVIRERRQRYKFETLAREAVINNNRLQLVLKGSRLGLWDWNPQTNEVVFDDVWCEMLGYTLDEIEPSVESWSSRVHPDDIDRCFADITAHIEGKTAFYDNIHRMRHKEGHWIYIHDRGKVVDKDENGVTRFTGTHEDLTRQIKVERGLADALRESDLAKKDLEAAMSVGRVGLFYHNETTGEIRVNTILRELYGAPESEYPKITRELVAEQVLEQDRPILKKAFEQHDKAESGTFNFEIRLNTGDAGIRNLLFKLSKQVENDETVLRGAVLDVSSLRDVERRLRDEMAKQEQMYAVIGHELRTPASALKMLIEEQSIVDLKPHGALIEESIDHLLNVLDDMRIITKPELVLDSPEVEGAVDQVISRSVRLVERLVQEKHLRVQVRATDEGKRPCLMREQLIRQITLNLVKNCAFHSHATELLITVSAQELDTERLYRIVFSDNGKGIKPQDRERVFTAYQRGDTQADGTGLGLHISRTYARNILQGDLSYQESPSGGAEFVLTARLPIVSDAAVQVAATVDVAQESILLGRTVLYAEDSPVLRMMTVKTLENQGAHVLVAEDGVEALELAETERFDLVITDLFMPNLDGFEVTRRLRDNGYTGIIIALTAAVVGDETEQVLAAGANEVMPKPLKIQELKATIWSLRELLPTTDKPPAALNSSRRFKILVVDDDPITLGRFDSLLDSKYDVVTEDESINVLGRIETTAPDLILCDINMPNMSGFELLDALKRTGVNAPIVMMSSDVASAHYLRIADAVGSERTLDKRATDQQILTLIEDALSQAGVEARVN